MNSVIKKDVWVLAEYETHGTLTEASKRLFSPARMIAAQTGGYVTALCTSDPNDELTGLADRLLVMKHLPVRAVTQRERTAVISHLTECCHPAVLLIADTISGRDLAAGIAARTEAMLAIGCENVKVGPSGALIWYRTGFSDSLRCGVALQASGQVPSLQIVTMRLIKHPLPFLMADANPKTACVDADEFLRLMAYRNKAEIITCKTEKDADLQNARVVVAGGRGVGGPEGFRLITALAEALNGAAAASRPVVDSGWAARSQLVGQSGKTIAPRLYIACGISGSVAHLSGIQQAEKIISINCDPNAPVFHVSDICVVGDLFKILPAWIKELNKIRFEMK